MTPRIRLKSLTSVVGWRETARFVREAFKRQGFRQGVRVFLAKMVREPLAYGLPTFLRRYWAVFLFGAVFSCSAIVLVLAAISPDDLASLAADDDPSVKLDLVRFVVAVLTFALALVGGLMALGQIRRALARPDLYPVFADGSTYHSTPFEMPRASGDTPWTQVPIYLRNVSRVAANHAKVTLTFENAQPFVIRMVESLGMPATSWQSTGNTKQEEWEFRSVEPFRVYGEDDYMIGSMHLSLPPRTLASDLGWDLPKLHQVPIYPVVHDDSGRRQRPMLLLTVQATSA